MEAGDDACRWWKTIFVIVLKRPAAMVLNYNLLQQKTILFNGKASEPCGRSIKKCKELCQAGQKKLHDAADKPNIRVEKVFKNEL